MKKIVLVLGLLAIAGCAGSYKSTFPSATAAEPVNLYIAPILNQEEIAVQAVVAKNSTRVGYLFGAIGTVVGSAVDFAVTKARTRKAELRAEVLREATLDYDLANTLYEAVSAVDRRSIWTISKTDKPIAATERRAHVISIFDSSDVDAVVLLLGNYQLTPDIDQVRADIWQRVYNRSDYKKDKKLRPSVSRLFTYLSPAHTLNYRSFNNGEKNALIEAAKERAAGQAETTPAEAIDINKALEKELKQLSKSTTIPEHIAIKETWTPALLKTYLDQSAEQLSKIIEFDWSESTVPKAQALGPQVFFVINPRGTRARLTGREVARLNGNVIYRARNGGLYSVPE